MEQPGLCEDRYLLKFVELRGVLQTSHAGAPAPSLLFLPLPSFPLAFPALPLEVGPLLRAARGSGEFLGQHFSSLSGPEQSPAAKRYCRWYIVYFKVKNLASNNNDLLELFGK